MAQENKIKSNAIKLIKLTDNIPAGIFQLKMYSNGKLKFEFLSGGMKLLHPTVDMGQWEESPEIGFNLIHLDDLQSFLESLQQSFKNISFWYHEYRVKSKEGYRWHVVNAKPERMSDGSVVWYGCFQDITNRVEYESAMEQMAFDISHVLRKPVTSLLGLTQLANNEKGVKHTQLMEYLGYIKTASKELDGFIHDLNAIYQVKKGKIAGQFKGNYSPND